MTKSIETKLKKSDDKTNNNKYRISLETLLGPGIDYIVASLFTRYPTTTVIIPEGLHLIGQF